MTDVATPHRQRPEVWRPLTGMPEDAHGWGVPGYAAMAEEWAEVRERLKDRAEPKAFVDLWLVERARAFAIETGQIEGLYTMRRGITLQLMAEGLEGVVGAHTLEGLEDRIIRGLLADQEAVLRMVFDDILAGRPLTLHTIKTWHQLITRHQETVTGLTLDGRKVHVRFLEKGRWKDRPNNPGRPDGVVHQYCPPEQVQQEMDRFIELYGEIRDAGYPTEVEAAWMHHRFVRTHPFRDGNGRVSRLLMAHAYVRRGEPPPVIGHEIRRLLYRCAGGCGRGRPARVQRLPGLPRACLAAFRHSTRAAGPGGPPQPPERQRRTHHRHNLLPASRGRQRGAAAHRGRVAGARIRSSPASSAPSARWPRRPWRSRRRTAGRRASGRRRTGR